MAWFDDLRQDLRFAARTLAHSSGFAGAAIATLAFGIGLAVAMFTVFDAVLRRPLPVQDQERVVVLWGGGEGSLRKLPLTQEHFERFREEARTLVEVAGTISARRWPHAVREGDRTLSLGLAAVTGNFFSVLGSPPVAGRTLRADDDVGGAAPVMVISHGLWRRQFDGDPDVIGRRVTLHERELTYTVVGVASPDLEYRCHRCRPPPADRSETIREAGRLPPVRSRATALLDGFDLIRVRGVRAQAVLLARRRIDRLRPGTARSGR